MEPLVELAKKAVEEFVRSGEVTAPPREMAPEMRERAGVFVCIKRGDDLRGCMGTITPTRRNVAEETVHCAIDAATEDPRFPPVTESELEGLSYTVDVLMPAMPVEDIAELDPARYGLIVESGYRRALLLPGIESIETAEEQLFACKYKAGIQPDEPVKLSKFEVKRYT